MTKIYLIRHTQAEGNLYRMMQGHWDGDVTAVGRRQIDALAARFASIPVDAVYASDLYRARLTATAITRTHSLPVLTDIRLREINVGPWETEFFGNVFHADPEAAELFVHHPSKWHIDGAETYAQVADRAFPALEEIARRHPEQSVAIVSHGVTIRCLLSRVTGIDVDDVAALPISRNTSVAELHYSDGVFSAASIDDCSHLEALGLPAWSRTPALRDESFDPRSDAHFYRDCYADSWKAAHGSLKGYVPETYYDSAVEHYKQEPRAVMRIYSDEEPVGLIDLDTQRGVDGGYGWISLIYLKPEQRGKGCGIQLLARAMKLYTELGRDALRLHVAQSNAAALAFYKKEGFQLIEERRNSLGLLLTLEKKLEGERDAC